VNIVKPLDETNPFVVGHAIFMSPAIASPCISFGKRLLQFQIRVCTLTLIGAAALHSQSFAADEWAERIERENIKPGHADYRILNRHAARFLSTLSIFIR
jgi:hypothetical protein